jgi:hypothetical protein
MIVELEKTERGVRASLTLDGKRLIGQSEDIVGALRNLAYEVKLLYGTDLETLRMERKADAGATAVHTNRPRRTEASASAGAA